MIKKIINKSLYVAKTFSRNIFYFSRFLKNKNKEHWSVKDFKNYDEYIEFQKEKTLDKKRRDKWLNEEWNIKTDYFLNIFSELKKEMEIKPNLSALCIGARTGQEVVALNQIGFSAIGIDIVECKPHVIYGDMHNLDFKSNSIDFIFCNIIDHSLYPQKSISEIERVLNSNGLCFLQVTVGEATDHYGVTEIKSADGILNLFQCSDVIFSRSIKKYSIAQNWEMLLRKK